MVTSTTTNYVILLAGPDKVVTNGSVYAKQMIIPNEQYTESDWNEVYNPITETVSDTEIIDTLSNLL